MSGKRKTDCDVIYPYLIDYAVNNSRQHAKRVETHISNCGKCLGLVNEERQGTKHPQIDFAEITPLIVAVF